MQSVIASVRQYFETGTPPDVISAYVFGSHATGRAHRDSDIDVAVLLDYEAVPDRAARGRRAVRLNADIIAATHRNDVDVVVLNDAPAELGSAVVRSGVRVYCAHPEADHIFQRTVLLRYADLRPFLDRTRRVKLEALQRRPSTSNG